MHHVCFGSKVRLCPLGRFALPRADSKRFNAACAGADRCKRTFAHAMTSCSRARDITNCGGNFLTSASRVVILDCSSRFVSSCSTRSTARAGSPAARAWSTASLRYPCSANHADAARWSCVTRSGRSRSSRLRKEFHKHLVVAKPIWSIVDAVQEQTALLDVLEHRLLTAYLCQCRREPAARALGDGRRRRKNSCDLSVRGCPGRSPRGTR